MKRPIDYKLQGFGYFDLHDFYTTLIKTTTPKLLVLMSVTSITLGAIREFIEKAMGLDILVLGVFVFLIIAEWQTGIKADMKKRNSKFQSRKMGRMILKIGVYNGILLMLYTFASKTKSLDFVGFEVNPLAWLYYAVFIGIIFQLVISYLENLGVLGYSEAKGLAGIVLRKYNKWFDFDGEKDGDVLMQQNNNNNNE